MTMYYYKREASIRSLIFRLFLAVFLTLAGLAGLLVTRLRHPLALDILKPLRAAAPQIDPLCLQDPALLVLPLMKQQFQIDLVAAALAILGFLMIVYYRRRLSGVLKHLEEMGLDRW